MGLLHRWVAGSIVLGAHWIAAAPARADTRLVPAQYPTIQDALDAAVNGDEIRVARGIYFEHVDFHDKRVVLVSLEGASRTVIDAQGTGAAVRIAGGQGPETVLEGFTLRNGFGDFSNPGGGLLLVGCSPVIRANRVQENTSNFANGGAIHVRGGSPLLEANLVHDNTGVGVFVEQNAHASLVGNVIRDSTESGIRLVNSPATVLENQVLDNDGGGVESLQGNATIRRNLVAENFQFGVRVTGGPSTQVLDNRILDNRGSFAGGIDLFAAGTPRIAGNLIRGNTAQSFGSGGGIGMVNNSNALIENNVILANFAPEGGGIACSVPAGSRGPIVRNNTIVGNTAIHGGGIFSEGFDGRTLITSNVVVAPAGQSAIECSSDFDPDRPILQFNDAFAPGGTAWAGSCPDLTGIEGNLSSDPRFADAAGGDFALRSDSPCIDAGDPSLALSGLDFAEGLRWLDGNLDGGMRIDMGAFELANVRLRIGGDEADSGSITVAPGARLDVKLSGNVALDGFLLAGLNPDSFLLQPFGVLAMDPSRVILARGPLRLPAVFPLSVPASAGSLDVILQGLALSPAPAGNLSNSVSVHIRPLP